ncbi:PAS domain S-box protein [Aliarcobacter cryaerophilus]|uniref:PAS domain-containing sensor histidine kinase n=1 Tax=Aliarcobacter cryaerophilus TaxID=28198 RepID=UPI0021B60F2B|nr:PAS domain-containing sensor histidine kinase [Aliarcobacter cryaerophilus]MCT7533935.1 PAS domain S-box protein [Aliarcobacter cryaerophilus]
MKNRSLLFSFLLPFLITIITISSFYTIYSYFETKQRLVNEINLKTKSILTQLKYALPHFIDSYAINEYKKLIENEMQDSDILAVIVKDYNYGKIFSKEFLQIGKIRENDKILDFNRNDIYQNNLLDKKFSYTKVDLLNESDIKIATLELYISDKNLKHNLNEIVKKSILEIFILSLFIVILVFLIIKSLILKPILNIVNTIQNSDIYGIPKENVPENNRVKEFNDLSKKMNEMIFTIKDLQKQIIKEKDFISNIIDNSNVIVAVIDSFGRMFKINKFGQEFIGYKQEEISSKPFFWLKFLHKDIQATVGNIIEKAKSGNLKRYYKASCISKDGEEKIFEWSNSVRNKSDGSMDYLVLIGIDVTQKELIQKEILQQKEELELIFNYSKDGIAILDLNTKLLNFNNSFIEMTGYSKDELLEKTAFEMLVDKDIDKNKIIIKKILEEGFITNHEETFAFKEKRVFTNFSVSLLPNKETLLMIIKDVSSLKVLQEQSKLASLGEMIGNIAHQWRQPLSLISTVASSLKVKSEYDMLTKEDINEVSTSIVKQTEYLSNTIDNFRDFIKGDKSYTNISIKDVLDNSLTLVAASLSNNFINLIIELNDDLTIFGNKNELTEAFLNIISNSKDILKTIEEKDRFIFIKSKKIDENRLELKFLDSGGGIDEALISRVFEPYFTTKHKSQGTGLGLPIVDKIVRERHKASIEIYNEEFIHNQKKYKGFCFKIIFKTSES